MGFGTKVISKAKGLGTSYVEMMKSNGAINKVARGVQTNAAKEFKNARAGVNNVASVGEDTAEAIKESLKAQKAYETAKANYKNVSNYKDLRQANRNMKNSAENLTTMNKVMAEAQTVGQVGKEYFLGGDWKRNSVRIGTAAAGYAGVNLAGRAITGGTATTNNKGERDIAGIPFV